MDARLHQQVLTYQVDHAVTNKSVIQFCLLIAPPPTFASPHYGATPCCESAWGQLVTVCYSVKCTFEKVLKRNKLFNFRTRQLWPRYIQRIKWRCISHYRAHPRVSGIQCTPASRDSFIRNNRRLNRKRMEIIKSRKASKRLPKRAARGAEKNQKGRRRLCPTGNMSKFFSLADVFHFRSGSVPSAFASIVSPSIAEGSRTLWDRQFIPNPNFPHFQRFNHL